MPVFINPNASEHHLEIQVSRAISAADCDAFSEAVDALSAAHGRLRMLVVLRSFGGWTLTGLWETVQVCIQHSESFDRVAIVGEAYWHKWFARVCALATNAEVLYFELTWIDDARYWLAYQSEDVELASIGRGDVRPKQTR